MTITNIMVINAEASCAEVHTGHTTDDLCKTDICLNTVRFNTFIQKNCFTLNP